MIDYETCPSLTRLFFDQAARLGDKPFLWAKSDGAYHPKTWAEAAAEVMDLARGLKALGLNPGERVVIVAENRPEWLVADLAIMTAGGITVPAYTTNTTSDHLHILTDSGAAGTIVSTKALADRVRPAAEEARDCRWLVAMEDIGDSTPDRLEVHSWDAVMARGQDSDDSLEAIINSAGRGDTACFIYTSGTGGAPKGVMLSHGSIICNCMGAHHLLETFGLSDEVFLSFLPLSHSYEHTAGQFFPISIGAQIYYAESIDKLLNNLAEAQPTIMTAVPRLYETMHQRIRRGVEKQGGLKAKLFHRAEALGRKKIAAPGSLSLIERLQDRLVERLVREKVRGRFGGRLKAMVSGGAALNLDIGTFFTALGLPIFQGYGQTEAAPVVSANPPGHIKLETVGPPLKGVEVKIAEDGEILVRGELVMLGYWQDPEATARAIHDGWLHTGDIGELDQDGYLKITDRKKDIVVLSGGDNLSPARVESFLTLQPEIAQAMAYGDRRPHIVALIVPDADYLKSWAKENGKAADLAALQDDPALHKALAAVVERVNKGLSNLERVRRFTLAAEPFSTDNAMLTPTMKIRRHRIVERYGERLETLYGKK